MNCHQSTVFLQDRLNYFHRWLNLFHSSFWRASKILTGGNRRHSQILKTEEEFLVNLAPFSSRFAILACCHPLIIICDCGNSFHPSGAIQDSFQFVLRSPSSHNYSFPAFIYRSPNLTGASINYPLISS